MAERKFDQMLHVRTTGLGGGANMQTLTTGMKPHHMRPWKKLVRFYKFKQGDQVVDFGSGRGRVTFYIHYHFNIPVTGVENNELTYEEALYNKALYRQKNKHLKAPIRFEFGLAENYQIQPEDNVFYFLTRFQPKYLSKSSTIFYVQSKKISGPLISSSIILCPSLKSFLRKKPPLS